MVPSIAASASLVSFCLQPVAGDQPAFWLSIYTSDPRRHKYLRLLRGIRTGFLSVFRVEPRHASISYSVRLRRPVTAPSKQRRHRHLPVHLLAGVPLCIAAIIVRCCFEELVIQPLPQVVIVGDFR